jgi:hypothetical protein
LKESGGVSKERSSKWVCFPVRRESVRLLYNDFAQLGKLSVRGAALPEIKVEAHGKAEAPPHKKSGRADNVQLILKILQV